MRDGEVRKSIWQSVRHHVNTGPGPMLDPDRTLGVQGMNVEWNAVIRGHLAKSVQKAEFS